MKKLFIFCLTSLIIGTTSAQTSPVQWTFEAVKKSAQQYEIVMTAEIDAPWHIYSQFVKGGPVPTSFRFKMNPLIQLQGNTKEVGKLEKSFDKNFNATIATFSNKVQFIQSVMVKNGVKTKLSGTVEYMVCDDSHCLPPKRIPFEVSIQ